MDSLSSSNEFYDQNPAIERQYLQQLIRNAQKEKKGEQTLEEEHKVLGKNQKKLKKFLKEQLMT